MHIFPGLQRTYEKSRICNCSPARQVDHLRSPAMSTIPASPGISPNKPGDQGIAFSLSTTMATPNSFTDHHSFSANHFADSRSFVGQHAEAARPSMSESANRSWLGLGTSEAHDGGMTVCPGIMHRSILRQFPRPCIGHQALPVSGSRQQPRQTLCRPTTPHICHF